MSSEFTRISPVVALPFHNDAAWSDALKVLAAGAHAADSSVDWPGQSWSALLAAGTLARSIPKDHGGVGLGQLPLLIESEALASACLTTAFVLSQREAAIRRIRAGPARLRALYLPGLAVDDVFVTIGLSQLTTSQRPGSAAFRATAIGTGAFRLDGTIPWVTGADEADAIVIGAALDDGTQLLAALPTDRAGVRIDAPMQLAALNGSRTAAVHCDAVHLEAEDLIAGPEQPRGSLGGGGLETSCLALGLSAAALELLGHDSQDRPALAESTATLRTAYATARQTLHLLAAAPVAEPEPIMALRVECTRLALATTQAALVAAKGTGFVVPHPAQRLARQALFFLVWSCPRPVADSVLGQLASTP